MMNENIENKQELRVKQLGVFELRGLAREIGIPSPTTKKREELINLILEKFKSGIELDYKEKRKGRPFKKLSSIDHLVNSMTDKPPKEQVLSFENIMTFAQEMPTFLTDTDKQEKTIIEAIVRRDKDKNYNANDGERWVLFDSNIDSYKKLRQGDKVLVEAVKLGQSNQYSCIDIIKINDINAEVYQPAKYKEYKEILSKEYMNMDGISLIKGRRNAIINEKDLCDDDRLENITKYCQDNKIKLVVLGINTSFEDQLIFENFAFEDFTSKYGTEDSINFNIVINAITYVNRLLERGENVLFYILDIMEIVRLADRCFAVTGENILHSKNTMTLVCKLMELGVNYQEGHSSTLLIGYNKLDKDDIFLKSEILRICNLVE